MLNCKDRIIRANIQLQKMNSFWAYLSLCLKFKEVKAEEMLMPTMGIDENGNVYYVKEFIDKLDDDELIGTISHEICHLVFLSQLRRGSRDSVAWNCASDLAINSLLKNNKFKLPDGVLMPDDNDEIEV